jgi:hypothetical protein
VGLMTNGYLAAAEADLAAAYDIADGFGLEVIDHATIRDPEAAIASLSQAANIGLLLSHAAARDMVFVSFLQVVAARALRAQLVLVEADAAAAFPFLPTLWPSMPLDEARRRAGELKRRRDAAPVQDEPAHAAPMPAPPADEPPPAALQQPEQPQIQTDPADAVVEAPAEGGGSGETLDSFDDAPPAPEPESELETVGASTPEPEKTAEEPHSDTFAAPESDQEPEPAPPPAAEAPEPLSPSAGAAAPPMPAPAPQSAAPAPPVQRPRQQSTATSTDGYGGSLSRAPERVVADATAFAPKKLRRGTPELVRIAIHQPKDLQAVIKAARKADPTTSPAPQSMGIGEIAIGAKVGVSLEVRGATCDGALQRREWRGDPLDFAYVVEADAGVKQVVILARVFVDDAQIGVLAFTRPVSGPAKKAASDGDRARLRRFKRVFISYSSADRETVSQIATAYEMAGVPHFFDRTSLKSGEEWSPRLRKEIDRSDLFHLCWSKSAAASEWVEKEAEYALTRRRRANDKAPAITVQMLDGPPWAPHPKHLDSINFDDFVRAAIVGYARGEG